MEGGAGVDGVMGGFGASRVGRAHLLANRRVNRIVLNPPRPIHHFGRFERSYRLYFLPCGHPTFPQPRPLQLLRVIRGLPPGTPLQPSVPAHLARPPWKIGACRRVGPVRSSWGPRQPLGQRQSPWEGRVFQPGLAFFVTQGVQKCKLLVALVESAYAEYTI